MNRGRARRIAVDVLSTLLLVALFAGTAALSATLRPLARISGFALLALTVLLAAYNVRKRLPFLPLLSSATWKALHTRVGLVALAIYLIHAGPWIPAGALNRLLALLFLLVAGSGIVGLALTLALPRRLAARGEEVLFERIPRFRRRLREQAEQAVLLAAQTSGATTLADFYARELVPFFSAPCHFGRHLSGSERPLLQLLGALAATERYLDEVEREGATALRSLVRAKYDLDFHRAQQVLLRGWLFAHVGLTWSLILVGFAHGALNELFSGALP